jgi:hypothetical protein
MSNMICETLRTIFLATGLTKAIAVAQDLSMSEVELPLNGCCMSNRYRRGTTLDQLQQEAKKFVERVREYRNTQNGNTE